MAAGCVCTLSLLTITDHVIVEGRTRGERGKVICVRK